jgi:acylphosphatase
MDPATRKKMIFTAAVVLAAISLPVALLAGGAWSMWKDYRARNVMQAAYSEALRESAERAADVVMPVPTLTDQAIELSVPPGQLESELQRVIRLAHGIGGSAASWNDGRSVRIVANVPSTALELFRDAVNSNVVSMTAAGDSPSKTVVQILLKPAE